MIDFDKVILQYFSAGHFVIDYENLEMNCKAFRVCKECELNGRDCFHLVNKFIKNHEELFL